MDILKLNKNELKDASLKGMFLYSQGDEFCFADRETNVLFEKIESGECDGKVNIDKKFISLKISQFCNGNQEKLIDFDKYLEEFCNICSNITNKPSLLMIHCDNKKTEKMLGDSYLYLSQEDFFSGKYEFNVLDERPCVVAVSKDEGVFLDKLFQSRKSASRELYVLFNEPELSDVRSSLLEVLVTIARGQRINFILNFKDSKNYDEFSYMNIKGNCLINIQYN